jgi:outer membrane protein assembly factor BamB/uncharacterized membrane protein
MPPFVRHLWGVLCFGMLLVSLGGVARGQAFQPDLLLRLASDDTYVGDNLYNSEQSRAQTVSSGVAAIAIILAQNDGDSTDTFTLTGTAGGAGWAVRYFLGPDRGTEVTAQLLGAGWTTGAMAPRNTRVLRVEVTPDASVTGGASKTAQVVARSSGGTDAVTFLVTRGGGAPSAQGWPMFRHNPQHTGLSPFTGVLTPQLKWASMPSAGVTGGAITASSPAIGRDGTIFIGSTDKKLYAFTPSGAIRWTYLTGDSIESSPAIAADGTIYVGSRDGSLYALTPTGTLRWRFITGGPVRAAPTLGVDGTIYLASTDGSLYAVAPTGEKIWAFATGTTLGLSAPALSPDGTIYVGANDKRLYAVTARGTSHWIYTTGDAIGWSSPAVGADGTIYVGSYDGALHAIAAADGKCRWTLDLGGWVRSSPAIGADGTIYVGSLDDRLHAISPAGTRKWSFLTGYDVDSSPAIGADGTIYVGSGDKNLYAIRPDGTKLWAVATGNQIQSSPAIAADGTLYVGSLDKRLYAIGVALVKEARPDLHIRTAADLEYSGDNVYQVSAEQTRAQTVAAHTPAIYQLRLQNDLTSASAFRLTGTAGSNGWTIKYMSSATGGSDITAQLAGLGWQTPVLVPGATLDCRVEVTPGSTIVAGSTKHVLVSAVAVTSPTLIDTVQASTTRSISRTLRASISSTGLEGDDPSQSVALSGDGQVVAFVSTATTFVANDTPTADVFVHLLTPRLTERVSISSTSVAGDGDSSAPLISRTGRFVLFASRATNLVAGDTNAIMDVFVRDRMLSQTERVSVDSDGTQATGPSLPAGISEDGRFVLFISSAPNLATIDTNTAVDLFVRDRLLGLTLMISKVTPPVVPGAPPLPDSPGDGDSGGTLENGNLVLTGATLTPDGRYVTFATKATNLHPSRENGHWCLLRKDLTNLSALTRIGDPLADGGFFAPVTSANGQAIAFCSTATNLGDNDADTQDILLIDLASGSPNAHRLISTPGAGVPADGNSTTPAISADGRFIGFLSTATNLVDRDTNGLKDAFLLDRTTNMLTCVSRGQTGVPVGATSLAVNDDGTTLAFSSEAATLVADDTNVASDCFVYAADGGMLTVRPDALIRAVQDATFQGDDLYGLQEGQQARGSTVNGQAATFVLALQNDGEMSDQLCVSGSLGEGGWQARYFSAEIGGADITAAVSEGLWMSPRLQLGEQVTLRVELTPDANLLTSEPFLLPITVISTGDPSTSDTVIAEAHNALLRGRPDLFGRVPGAPFLGDNVYASVPQLLAQEVLTGQAVSYLLMVQNDADRTDSLRVTMPRPTAGWTVRAFDTHADGQDITTALTGAGWTVANLPSGTGHELRVEIVGNVGLAVGAMLENTLTVTSIGDPGVSDALSLQTTSAASQQPDLLLKVAGDTTFIGDNIYNSVEPAQEAITHVGTNQPASFTLRLQNDGNQVARFTLTCAPAATGWALQARTASGSDLTTLLLGTGWSTPQLNIGSSQELTLELTPTVSVPLWTSARLRLQAVSTTGRTDVVWVMATKIGLSAVTLTAAPEAPHPAFSTITLRAAPVGGHIQEYAFEAGYSSGGLWTWESIRAYAPSTTCSWRPEEARTWTLRARAREVGSPDEVTTILAYRVTSSPDTHQPDLTAQLGTDGPVIGQGIYSATGEAQTLSQNSGSGVVTTYLLRVTNTGNVADTYTLAGAGARPGWTVRYFTLATGGTDITPQMTGSGWPSAPLPPSATMIFRVEVSAEQTVVPNDDFLLQVTAKSNQERVKVDRIRLRTRRVSLLQVALSTNLPAPRLAQTPITLMASATGGDSVEFQFRAGCMSGGSLSWTTLQAFSPRTTCAWRPDREGTWSLVVLAREAGTTPYISTVANYAIVPPLSAVRLQATPTASCPTGTPVTLKALPTNGAVVTYQFRVGRKVNGAWQWTVQQPYSPAATCVWTPQQAGSYSLVVLAREGIRAPVSTALAFTATAPAPTAVTLTASPVSPAFTGTLVTLNASAQGGQDVQYQFRIGRKVNGVWQWTTQQTYSSVATCDWTPTLPDSYALTVWARSTGSMRSYEVYRTLAFVVKP